MRALLTNGCIGTDVEAIRRTERFRQFQHYRMDALHWRLSKGKFMAGGDDSIVLANSSKGVTMFTPATTGPDAFGIGRSPFAISRKLYWRIKRPLGLAFSIFLGLLALPAIVIIALILAQQGRPVFIRRRRLGLHGRPFTVLRFRTMPPNSWQSLHEQEVPENDAFGRLLHRTRLDHLPMLWNVIRGDMNLVGPLPMSQEELFGAGRLARHTLSIRPGVTGTWWVNGDHELRRRLASDRAYIDCASPILDLKVIFRTIAHMHGV